MWVAFKSPSTLLVPPLKPRVSLRGQSPPQTPEHTKTRTQPCQHLHVQLRFMKKTEKAKALKPTARKSFHKAAPETSVGCVSTVLAPVATGELECRGTNLRPLGTTVQRYRQEKKAQVNTQWGNELKFIFLWKFSKTSAERFICQTHT